MKQYFVITDVHGRLPQMKLFKERGFDQNNPNHFIIALGDYFDRGVQNRKVLRFFTRLKKTLGSRCILIYGNHDQYFMDFTQVIEASCTVGEKIIIEWPQFERWMFNGGFTTLSELFGSMQGKYTQKKHDNIQVLKAFGALLVPYYETEDFIFTHASINEHREVDTWDRSFLDKGIACSKTILIGHTPHKYLEGVADFVSVDILGDGQFSYTYAQSKLKTLCNIWNIDNGQGDNIVVLSQE